MTTRTEQALSDTQTAALRVPYDTISNALAAHLAGNGFEDHVWTLLGATSRQLRSELYVATMLLRFRESGRLIRLQAKHEHGTRVQDSSLKQTEVWSDRGVLRPVHPEVEGTGLDESVAAELEVQRADHELLAGVQRLVAMHGEQFLQGDGLEPDSNLVFIEVQETTHRLPCHRHMEPYTTVWRFIVKHEASDRHFSIEQMVGPSGISTLCEPTEVFPIKVSRTEYVTEKESINE